ncbi:type IV pilus biogenesis/stability protein PilW [Aquabacterium sp.]|uniref:type IV pilus biogenesis/stability protein PilW n=1 Tax=Aquabacterium sp. TaxID=1872578 RepID=UPI0035B0758F
MAAAWILGVAMMGCTPMPVAGAAGRDIVTNSDESARHKRARVRLELATAYYAQGKLAPALDEVKQAISVDPDISDAFSLRGLIYDGLGDDGLAEASFRHALQIDPANAGAMHNYGWFMCRRKRYADADAMFVAAMAVPKYRDASQSAMVRGVCLARQGKLDDAEKALMHAYEIDAGNPTIAVNLTDVLYRRGEYERARFYIRRVNASQELANAESLWLAVKIEHRLGNLQGEKEFGNLLRSRFPSSREVAALDAGRFDE